MITIYKEKRTGNLYALNEMITMGNKVNLVRLGHAEEKFVSPSTLKRWYSKWDEANMVVQLKAFTGMDLGFYKVETETAETVSFWTKSNKFLVFDKKTDTQINAKNPKFANKLGDDARLSHRILRRTLQ